MSSTINRLGKKVLTDYEEGGLKSVLGGSGEDVRLGIVGAGRHGRANLWPCLCSLPVMVKAVCAAHQESAERWGRRLGALSFYDDVQTMLENEGLDAVIACVGPEVHTEVISICLDRKLPLFVEKPAGLAAAQVAKLAEMDPNRKVVVGFQKRFAPNYAYVQEAISKARMGGLDSLHMEFGVGPLPGGMEYFLREVGLHFIDLARFFAPDLELVSVRRKSSGDEIHTVLAHFETPDGVLISLYLSSGFDWANCHERVMASFRRGTVTVNNLIDIEVAGHGRSVMGVPLDKVIRGRRFRQQWHPNLISGAAESSSQAHAGFLPELTHFVREVVIAGRPSQSSLHNAARSQELAEQLGSV